MSNRHRPSYCGLFIAFGVTAIITGASYESVAAPVPRNPVFNQQWGFNNTGQKICDMSGSCQSGITGKDVAALAAWKIHKDCQQVTVAVLDTGADFSHPDLKGNVISGKNFVVDPPSLDASDDNLHGTHVSGTIAATGTPSVGAAGVCASAKVIAVKVGDAYGGIADSDIIAGIGYAVSQGARVLNASFGGGGRSTAMANAIKRASKMLFVVAAGNGDWSGRGYSIDSNPVYPASYGYSNIIVVAATDNRDELGSFSNYGPKSVHIAAPGVGIASTVPVVATDEMKSAGIPAKYAFLDGTSMATPHVTGAAALLLGYRRNLTPSLVRKKLMSSVDRIPALTGKVRSGGRLNLIKLLQ